MGEDIAELGISIDSSGVVKADDRLDNFNRTAKEGEKSAGVLSSAYVKLAGAIGSVVAAGAALGKITEVTREFETLNASLITATGSAEAANVQFKELQDFASETPFALQEVVGSFIKLKNLGLDPSERALASFGNTAAAMGKSLDQFIEAVADAAVGEFERLKEFGIKASSQGDKVVFTFRGVETQVAKSATAIQSFLTDLGENEFAGAMAQRVDTLDGTIVNLEDNWSKLLVTIGETTGITDTTQSAFAGLSRVIQDINTDLGGGTISDEIGLIERRLEELNRRINEGEVLLQKEADTLESQLFNLHEKNRLIEQSTQLQKEAANAAEQAAAQQAIPEAQQVRPGLVPFAPDDDALDFTAEQLAESSMLWDEALQAQKDRAIQHSIDLQQIEADRINSTNALRRTEQMQALSATSTLFGGLAALAATGGEKYFKIQQKFAIAQTLIDTYAGAQKAIAQLGVWGVTAAVGITLAGLARVRSIKQARPGVVGGAGAGGEVSGLGGGVAVPAQQQQQQTQRQDVSITISGDNFSGQGVRDLIEEINDAISDGAQLNVRAI
jgi:hypothetical protein